MFLVLPLEKCISAENPVNFCGIFTGQLNLYGSDQNESTMHVIEEIEEVLSPSDPTKLHPDILALKLDRQFFTIDDAKMNVEAAVDRSTKGWMVLTAFTFLFFILLWCFFFRGDKPYDTYALSPRTRNRRVWNKFYSKGQLNHIPYDPEDTSIGTYRDSAAVPHRDGDMLLPSKSSPQIS
jgi:hypothetical protein